MAEGGGMEYGMRWAAALCEGATGKQTYFHLEKLWKFLSVFYYHVKVFKNKKAEEVFQGENLRTGELDA